MTGIVEMESTVTERGQTTVPAAIRRALAVGPSNALIWRVQADGSVQVRRKVDPATKEDPVLARFLEFLEADMVARPDRLHPLSAAYVVEAEALAEGVEVDLDAPLPDDDDDDDVRV